MFDAESLFFFSLHSRAHSHLSNWINKKKQHKQLYALDLMINKKLKRYQLFSSLKTFLKDVLTFDLNQIINWYYVCTYDVFFISHFNLKTICSPKHSSVVSHILIRFTFARFVNRLSLIIHHFFCLFCFNRLIL